MADTALEQKRIRDDAAAWYARLNNTTISTDTLRAFRAWRRDDRHAEAYAEIEAFWERAGRLEHDRDIQRAAGEALARTPDAIAKVRRLGKGGVVGAILVALAITGGLYSWPALFGRSYATEVGEQRLVRLEDGSRLQLDTSTKVRVQIGFGGRRLEFLKGRAIFDVAHDPRRPFIVKAGPTAVQAIGTRFEVRRESRGAQVTLIEGRVRVTDERTGEPRSWTLQPGQQVKLEEVEAAVAMRTVDIGLTTEWTAGRLVFRDRPLGTAIEEVNRYTERKIILEDPELAARPITGAFNVGDTDAFVAAVSDLYGLRVERETREIRLARAG